MNLRQAWSRIGKALERGGPPSARSMPPARDLWRAMTSRGEIGWMGFVTLFVFILWMYQARPLIALFLGINAPFTTLRQFISVVLTA